MLPFSLLQASAHLIQIMRAGVYPAYHGRMSTPLQPLQVDTDPQAIARLIDRFYDKVSADDHIGPVFNAVVEDWDAHKRLLTSFWCSVALRAGTYRGNPLSKHQPLSIDRSHFERWLELWRETVPEVLDAEASAQMIEYAERIGRGMRMGLGLGDRPRGRDLGIPIRSVQPPQ